MIFKETRLKELKESYTKTYLKTVSAFSNYTNGEIFFGVKNDGSVIGVENIENLKLQIENAIADNIKPQPSYYIEELEVNSLNLIRLVILKGDNGPYFYNHKAYRRFDTSTVAVDNEELRRLIMDSEGRTFESLLGDQELNKDCFDVLKNVFNDVRGSDISISNDFLTTLRLINDKNQYTRAAEIVSDKPKHSYSSLDIVRFGETMSIFLERKTIEYQSILTQYQEGLKMFDKWYGDYEEVVGFYRVTRTSIPRESFREALANALVHQDFAINASIRISMFEDRIEIVSPGGLPFGISEDNYLNGEMSVPRNSIIADLFLRIKIIEKFGTGINRIKSGYYNFGEKPEFKVDSNMLKIVLPKLTYGKQLHNSEIKLEDINLDSSDLEIINTIYSNNTITVRELSNVVNINESAVKRKINELEKMGILEKVGSPRKRSYRVHNVVKRATEPK